MSLISWIVVGLVEEFSNLLSMLPTSNLLFVIKSFCLGFTSNVFLSFSKKTFFFWCDRVQFEAYSEFEAFSEEGEVELRGERRIWVWFWFEI